jgi:hypothetical protein
MTARYQELITAENYAKFLDAPMPPKYANNYAGLVG